ncbi:hypothetical protein [Poriferisphaera sp. WC338]|uniref:hypothetical protein n=1 Tax=Poriferisphaera sp. WC338 TaxID=3425129 RepID=UPI003D81B4FD
MAEGEYEPKEEGPGEQEKGSCGECKSGDCLFDEDGTVSFQYSNKSTGGAADPPMRTEDYVKVGETIEINAEDLEKTGCSTWGGKGVGKYNFVFDDYSGDYLADWNPHLSSPREYKVTVSYMGSGRWQVQLVGISGTLAEGENTTYEIYESDDGKIHLIENGHELAFSPPVEGLDYELTGFSSCEEGAEASASFSFLDSDYPSDDYDPDYTNPFTRSSDFLFKITGGGEELDPEEECGCDPEEGEDPEEGAPEINGGKGRSSGGCTTCTNASPTFATPSLASMRLTWGLGKDASGNGLGHIELHAEEWSQSLASLSSLKLYGNGISNGDITHNQVIVDSTANGKLVASNYDPDNDGTVDGFQLTGSRYDVISSSYITYMESIVTSPATNQVLVVQTQYDTDGTTPLKHDRILYEYSVNSGITIWEMKRGVDSQLALVDGASHTKLESWDEVNNSQEEHLKRYTAFDTSGNVIAVEERRYQEYGEGNQKIIEWTWGTEVNPDGSPGGEIKTRKWERYSDEADFWRFGKVKAIVIETGFWKYYEYDDFGKVITILGSDGTSYYEDPAAIDPAVASANALVVTATRYTPSNPLELQRGTVLNQTDSIYAYPPAFVTKVQTTVGSDVVKTKYAIRWPRARADQDYDGDGQVDTVPENQLDYREKWEIVCEGNPNKNGTTDEAFLQQLVSDIDAGNPIEDRVTRTRRYHINTSTGGVDVSNELKQRIGWDGEVIDYSYPDGNTTVVESGYSGARRRVSTREDSSRRVTGRLTSEQDQGGSWFDVNLVTTDYSQDRFNRPTSNNYYYGSEATNEWASEGSGTPTYSTSSSYGCCGIESQTGADGITTSYTYDDFYRYEHVEAGTGVQTKYTYDELGRVIKTERVSSDDSDTVVLEETFFNLSNQIAKTKDGRGICSFYTYRRIGPDGTTFNSATHDRMYRENRVYPHDSTSGPVQVTWKDSRGNVVRQWTGSSSSSWSEASPPVGDELLTELSRSVVSLDWADRAIETKFYHNLTGLTGIDDLGSLNTNYYVGTLDYDHWGRAWKQIDQSGNITISKFDDETGNLIETWVGTDATGATSNDPVGSGSNNMLVVSKVYYDTNYDGTGNRRAYPTKTITLGTTTNINSSSAHAVINEQFWDSVNDERVIWQKPAQDLWQKQVADLRGRTKRVESYSDDGSTLISKQTNVYDDSSTGYGRLIEVKQHEVISGVAGNYIASKYAYEDVEDGGRQIKADEPGGPITKQQFDLHGRLLRTVQISDEVGSDPTNFNDDIVLSEMVYEYDDNDNIIMTTTYSRLETVSDSQAGLLSDNPTSARVTYNATWYDDANRPTHVVDYGTNVPQ